MVHTRIPNLDTIPSGPLPPNPSELLGSRRMTSLLDMLRKHYGRIIIDSSPILGMTDAVVLTKFVDGVVLVVRAGETPRKIIQDGLGQLQAVNAHILGAVLNGMDLRRDGYYYRYYSYYYGEDGERKKRSRRKKKSKGRYGEEA